ncbi:MAG: TlpA family protein disulfide reductase [Pseudomonadota bacterium]|nr:TlpA family protein disulfide reductase [Pseudomonadota bacterium]
MSDEPFNPETPAPAVQASAAAASLHAPRVSRRAAMAAVTGLAALIAGWGFYQANAARKSPDRTSLTPHPVPRDAGALRFSDANGVPKSLVDFRSRVVLLNVWATWCPPCRDEMPTLDRLQASLGGPDFEVLTVSIDAEGLPVVRPFFKQIGIKHLHPYIDSFHEVGVLGAAGIPLTLLIDREGREVARKLGPATWDDPKVVQTIRGYLPTGKKS